MLRITIFTISLALAGCASVPRQSRADYYSGRTNFSVQFCGPDFHVQPEDRGQACSPDYAAVMVQAATKDEHALERLFYISAHSSWDTSPGECHTGAMRRMLLVWGDIDFARVLARQPARTRRKVVHNLNWAVPDPAIPYLFPHTYAVANLHK